MKKVVSIALASACLAAPALANPASRDITLQGHVDKFCSIAGTLTEGYADGDLTLSGDTVTIEGFTNAQGGHTGTNFTLKLPGTVCNYKARFRVAAAKGALENSDVTDMNGTARKVTYQIMANWNGVDTQLLAEGTPVDATSGYTDGYYNGDLVLAFTTNSTIPGKILQGGTYSDTLTVSLELGL